LRVQFDSGKERKMERKKGKTKGRRRTEGKEENTASPNKLVMALPDLHKRLNRVLEWFWELAADSYTLCLLLLSFASSRGDASWGSSAVLENFTTRKRRKNPAII